MFFVYCFYPNYLQLKAIVHHPYGGLSDGAEDNARTQEIRTSACSSRTSPVVQIACASLPSTELEQPSGSSGADNCAGNIQDSAAGEDNGQKRAEPLKDEDQPNHSNSKDVVQHDAIVHDCCCGLASPKPNFRVSTPIWTWQISVLSILICNYVCYLIYDKIPIRDPGSGIYSRSHRGYIYDTISDPFLILPCFLLTSLISCHLTSWTASLPRHVLLMLDTCS